MRIFDRWGNMVFITKYLQEPWDGKANYDSTVAQQDVYVYAMNLTDFKRKKTRV